MWLIGQVIDLQVGYEGERKSDTSNLTTVYLEAGQEITAVMCYTGHVPRDVLGQCVRIDAHLYEMHLVQEERTRLQLLYRAANYQGAIRILRSSIAAALRLPRDPL